jgi:tetratricopeptide (TPR) repeat protein
LQQGISILLFLLFVSVGSFAQNGLNEARNAAKRNDYKTCLQVLEDPSLPRNADFWSLSGACWLSKAIETDRAADFDTSIAHLSKAIQLDTTDALALSNRGTAIYYSLGDSEDKELMMIALHDYDRALQQNPYLRLAILNRAILLRNLGYYDESIASFDVLIADNANDPIMYLQRARAFAEATAHRTAINDYLKAIDLDSTLAPAYLEAGESYAWLGFYPRAKELQFEAMELDPKSSERAFFNLARFEIVSGDASQAAKYLKKARKGSYVRSKSCQGLKSDFFLQEPSENKAWNKQFSKLMKGCS